MTLNNAMSNTPWSPARHSQGRVQTWVKSQQKLLASPGHFSAVINFVNKLSRVIDTAMAKEDFEKSVEAWQGVFGEEFGKTAVAKVASLSETARLTVGTLLSAVAQHEDRIVDAVRDFGTRILSSWFYQPPRLKQPSWRRARGTAIALYISATHVLRQNDARGSRIASGQGRDLVRS